MTITTRVLAVLLSGGAIAGLAAQSSPRAPRPAPAASALSPVVSLEELMASIIDPEADVLFDAVSYEATATGVVEVSPQTEDEWRTLRRSALILIEAPNLLKIAGRPIVPAAPVRGADSEPAGPDELSPAEIRRRIDRDPPAFHRFAQGLQDAARVALKAIDDRDKEALFAAGEQLHHACENCHLRYWYPPSSGPQGGATAPRP